MLSDVAGVVGAAGSSNRMGFDKLWADLDGQPLIARTLSALRRVEARELVLVAGATKLTEASLLGLAEKVVPGGGRRRDSVEAGVRATECGWVAIHDCARPFVTPDLVRRGVEAAQATGAAIPIVPLKDTIKQVSNGVVAGTLHRDSHAAVQTPQVFRRDLLMRALALTDEDVTDEATLVERLGVHVATFAGEESNFKVTTPIDLALARVMLQTDGVRKD